MTRLRGAAVRLFEGALLVGLLAVFVGLLAVRPGVPSVGAASSRTVPVSAVSGGAPDDVPDVLKSAAADLLRQTVAKDGSGYRFEIVQRAVVSARPDGPLVPMADPADPEGKRVILADEAYQIGLVETGYVTPAGFYMAMRAGPDTADTKVDLAQGRLLFEALVSDGTTYRNDGQGWYPTDRPPGIGLDPRTAALLPAFLERAGGAVDIEPAALERELGSGETGARALRVATAVADLPGIVAADGEPFTELVRPIELTFDAAGRLSGLLVTARNTNVEEFDLIIVTEIAIAYDNVPTDLPEPLPVMPASTPVVQ